MRKRTDALVQGATLGAGLHLAPRTLLNQKEEAMNKEQVKGAVNEAAGKVQRQVGKVTGSAEQERKGAVRQVEGKAQKTVGNAKEIVQDANRKS